MFLRSVVVTVALWALAQPVWAATPEVAQTEPAIMVSLKFYRGKADGKADILSAPTVLAQHQQMATVVMGRECSVGDEEATVISGIHCDLKPTLRKDGKILVELNFTSTSLVEDPAPDRATAQGTCIRSAVIIKPGEKIQLGGRKSQEKNGVWLEVTAEVCKAPNQPPACAAKQAADP